MIAAALLVAVAIVIAALMILLSLSGVSAAIDVVAYRLGRQNELTVNIEQMNKKLAEQNDEFLRIRLKEFDLSEKNYRLNQEAVTREMLQGGRDARDAF